MCGLGAAEKSVTVNGCKYASVPLLCERKAYENWSDVNGTNS